MTNPTPWLIWGSMGSTQIALLVGSALMEPVGTDRSIGLALALIGLVTASASWFIARLPAVAALPPQTRSILRWALAESAAIAALMAWAFSADHLVQLPTAVFGLAAWLAGYPSDADAWPQGHGR